MSDAPERIWACRELEWYSGETGSPLVGGNWEDHDFTGHGTEYVRADLCADPALLAEAVEVLRWYAADGWKDETMEPPTADEIALHGGNILDFPMPSILSDRGDRARAFLAKWENRATPAAAAMLARADAAETALDAMRAMLATIVSRCDTAKQQCNDGEPVSAFNLASAILGQIGGYRATLQPSEKPE